MRILEPLTRRPVSPPTSERLSILDWFAYQGQTYQLGQLSGSNPREIDSTFAGYVDQIHRRNGPVAAAVTARALMVSQLRFSWRRLRGSDRPGELWGNQDLRRLEQPGWETRPQLLYQLEEDASYGGTGYVVPDGNGVRRLLPDRVSWVLGSNSDPEWMGDDMLRVPWDAEPLGIVYHPNKNDLNARRRVFAMGEFAAWSPEPDPVYFWRGQSWVSSVIREVLIDDQATDHFSKFFQNAATPNLVFLMDPSKSPAEVQEFARLLNANHGGSSNSFKNLFLGAGTDVKVVGSSLESLQQKDLQGGLETRVALRARIPGVIMGIREGYAGSSLNAGNYGSARRMWADGWFTPHAQSLCAALERIVPAPSGSELSYDPAEILFLQEDQKDAADILSVQATTINTLITAGYDPDTVEVAVRTGDFSKLKHTGNVSVQLQPPGSQSHGS